MNPLIEQAPRGARRRLARVLVALLAVSAPAVATTYVLGPDLALFEQAELVAEVEILEARALPTDGLPLTEYLALPLRILKGSDQGAPLVLHLPGSRVDAGPHLLIPGVPVLDPGERYIVFLVSRPGHVYGALHWGLGIFHRVETADGVVANRELAGGLFVAQSDAPAAGTVRLYEPFLDWLSDLSRGAAPAADYVVPARAGEFEPIYSLIHYQGSAIRWFEFDRGASVTWKLNPRGSGGSASSFTRALEAWNRDPVSNVRLLYGGRTGRTAGFACDGENTVVYGDPRKQVDGRFDCQGGGVLAAATPCLFTGSTRTYKGARYYVMAGSDIVVNDGAECYFDSRVSRAAELFTHELGHGLGIGHACGDATSGPCRTRRKDEATMRATVHDDGRGAGIRGDDKAALRKLYRATADGGGDGRLVAPSRLRATIASTTTGKLTWEDNSSNESGFQVWVRINAGSWTHWVLEPAGTTSLTFSGATSGATYTFRVRAQREDELSLFSNKARVRMPSDSTTSLGDPTELTVRATSGTEGVLAWQDNSSAETGFEIWLRLDGGAWFNWLSVPANSRSSHFWGASPGATYRFQVRALTGSGESGFSNIGRVTMPD
jgi:hypothetical protein